ncbi:MAG: sulfate transporter [Bryobacterales bacterium]|nr:sulfate transporter [Bryobacterales bacterium]
MRAPPLGELDATSGNLLHYDIPAGIVVFLVALPLCLGVALASGAPPFAGIISGIIGGIIVGMLSGSQISVSGPGAGLAIFVVSAIQVTGSYRGFLASLVLAGLIQMLFGALRFGALANYLPNSVIRGVLAAIGIVVILKQIPHAFGRDIDYEGDFSFLEPGGNTTFSDIAQSVMSASSGATILFFISLAVLLGWDQLAKRARFFQFVPGALVAVALTIGINQLFGGIAPGLQIISKEHLVTLPVIARFSDFFAQFAVPDYMAFANPGTWVMGLTLAIVASIETLFSLEASDRLDPYRRISPPNRELLAQGIGNVACGLLGGLPVASVVLRSSANVYAGARTWMSTFTHGILLLAAVFLMPNVLAMTPLAALAAILIAIGYRLTRPRLYREMFRGGWDQFIPFIVTVLAIVFTDLLKGVLVGFAFGAFFVFRKNHHEAITMVNDGSNYLLRFTKDASFVNKNEFRSKLRRLPPNSHVVIDGTRALFIDHDIMDVVEDFQKLAPYKNIHVELRHWKTYTL